MATNQVDEFVRALTALLMEFQQDERSVDPGRDRSVAYGNVRHQTWRDGDHINIGIIYETPGGSTNQINIEFRPATGEFAIPYVHDPGEFCSEDQEAIVKMVREHIEAIPGKRMERLQDYIDAWIEDRMERPMVFENLNKLIFQELKGGRITHDELREACRYAVAGYAAQSK